MEKLLEDRWGEKIIPVGYERLSESMTSALLNYYKSEQLKTLLRSVKDTETQALVEAFSNYHLSLDLQRSRFDQVLKNIDKIKAAIEIRIEAAEIETARTGRVDPPQQQNTETNMQRLSQENCRRQQTPQLIERIIESLRKES